MSAHTRDRTHLHHHGRRRYDALAYCCGFWGISAVLGGIALVAGMLPIPDSLLDGSPFPTYTIPGIALILVGAGSLLCGIALPQRRRWTVVLAGGLGVAQGIFLGVELVVIGFSWLLAIYALFTIATVALAAFILRHPGHAGHHRPNSSRDVRAPADHPVANGDA